MTRERARRLSWRATAYKPTELEEGSPDVIRALDGRWYVTHRGDPVSRGFNHAEEAMGAAEEFVAARETLASVSTEALARELFARSDSWGPSLELDGYELAQNGTHVRVEVATVLRALANRF